MLHLAIAWSRCIFCYFHVDSGGIFTKITSQAHFRPSGPFTSLPVWEILDLLLVALSLCYKVIFHQEVHIILRNITKIKQVLTTLQLATSVAMVSRRQLVVRITVQTLIIAWQWDGVIMINLENLRSSLCFYLITCPTFTEINWHE